jgi:beta-lactam-binding protein with PASTA domain
MRRRRRRVTEVDQPPPPTARRVEEQVVEPPPRRPPLLWPWLLLLLLLVGAGIALAYVLTREDESSSTERVPAVVGFRAPVAVERLRTAGYPSDIRRRFDPSRRGRVVEQTPDGGTELEPGRTVVIVVARAQNTVDVPNVVGLEVADAFERVQAAGLRARAVEVFARQAQGRVVRQRPPAREEAPRSSLVILNVSKGPQLVAVPTVIGQTEAQAVAAMRRVGLRPNVVRVPAPDPRGTVLDQNPPGGTRAPRRSTVRVNVSSGAQQTQTTTTPTTPALATVPNVIGQDETTASQNVREAGFRVQTRAEPTTDPSQDGIVQRQAPPPRRRVRAGSLVIIYVGRLT